MKKTSVAVILLSLSALASAWSVEVPNAGFEEGLANWQSGGLDKEMSTASAEAAHSGKMGLLVNDQDAQAGSYVRSARFRVQPGQELQLRFFARNISGSGMGVYLVFYNGKQKGEEAVAVVPADQGDWKEMQLLAKVPENATDVCILLHSSNRGQVVAHVDDISLTNLSTEH